jgi:hypothetical protein
MFSDKDVIQGLLFNLVEFCLDTWKQLILKKHTLTTYTKNTTHRKIGRAVLATCIELLSCLVSSVLKMEVTSSSEMSVDFQGTTWHFISEDRALYNHCYENLRPYGGTLHVCRVYCFAFASGRVQWKCQRSSETVLSEVSIPAST